MFLKFWSLIYIDMNLYEYTDMNFKNIIILYFNQKSCLKNYYSQTCLIRRWRDHQKKKSNYPRIRITKVMQEVYNYQGTHKKLRIIREFELYKFELEKFDCILYILIYECEWDPILKRTSVIF